MQHAERLMDLGSDLQTQNNRLGRGLVHLDIEGVVDGRGLKNVCHVEGIVAAGRSWAGNARSNLNGARRQAIAGYWCLGGMSRVKRGWQAPKAPFSY